MCTNIFILNALLTDCVLSDKSHAMHCGSCMWFLLNCNSLQVHKIYFECEDDDNYAENIIYVELYWRWDEVADQITDEDSYKSDEEHGVNLNHLGRRSLIWWSPITILRLLPSPTPSTSSTLGANAQWYVNNNNFSTGDSENESLLLLFPIVIQQSPAPPAK